MYKQILSSYPIKRSDSLHFNFTKLTSREGLHKRYIAGRASTWLQRHDRCQFRAPPMPAHRCVENNCSAVMLATKRSAGVTPEVNLRECVTCMSLPSMNKAAYSGFETQRRHHQKSKTGVSVIQQNHLCSPNKFLKITHIIFHLND